MSGLGRLTDAQRTTVLLELVGQAEWQGKGNGTPDTEKLMAARRVFLREVADGTGFARGYADALWLSLWHSDGYAADGYEIKASRADLKRELDHLDKWQRVGRYCRRWYLTVWDRRWLEDARIPAEWGLLAYDADTGALAVVRKAAKREPEPWSPAFVCALVRRAAESAPSAALLEVMRSIGYRSGRGIGLGEARAKAHERETKAFAPLLEHYRRATGSRWASEVPLSWVVEQALAACAPADAEAAP